MVVLANKERTSLHVLAFLYFRMGMTEKAERVYTALAALPVTEENAAGPLGAGGRRDALDVQAVLGLATLALERGAAGLALEHVHMLLDHARLEDEARLASSERLLAVESAAHLVRSQALRALGRMEEAAAAVQTFRHIQGASPQGVSTLEKHS